MAFPMIHGRIRPRLSAGAILLLGALVGIGPLHPAATRAAQPSRASGGGFYVGPEGRTTVALHALDHHNGNVQGEFEQQFHDLGFAVHGTVDCLCLYPAPNGGAGAVVSGVITNVQKGAGPVPVQEGDRFLVELVDNGEGRKAPPDQISPTLFGPSDCHAAPALPLFPLAGGNFQVVGPADCPPPGVMPT